MRDLKLLVATVLSLGLAPGANSSQAMGDLCSGGQASGTGLRGAYHSGASPKAAPVLVRVDASVSSDTLRQLPATAKSGGVSQVRWCGWIRPIVSGAHRFSSAGGGLQIEVDRRVVTGNAGRNVAVDLEAGKAYPIRIELTQVEAGRFFALQWTPPFGATYDVPPTVLFPPVETVKPGC